MQSPKDKCNSCRRRRFARRRWRTDRTRRPFRPRPGRRTGAARRPRPTLLTASCTPERRLAAGRSRFDRRGTSRAPGSGKPGRRANPMRTTSNFAGSLRSRSSRRTSGRSPGPAARRGYRLAPPLDPRRCTPPPPTGPERHTRRRTARPTGSPRGQRWRSQRPKVHDAVFVGSYEVGSRSSTR
jgi:hypothetical protein